MKIPNLLGNQRFPVPTTLVIEFSWNFQCLRKSKIFETQEMLCISSCSKQEVCNK